MDTNTKKILKWGGSAVLAILTILAAYGSFYVVGEGNVGVEKRFGKAVAQTDPGIHFKVPMIDKVHEMDVRERKSVEEMAAATENRLAITAIVSVNWSVNRENAIDLYRQYGSLAQFENRVLDPGLRSAAKTALAHFPADELIKNREAAIAEIFSILLDKTSHLPITVTSPQIENIALPGRYLESIQLKEQAKEQAIAEKYKLEKQNLESQQIINTANSQRDADKAQADGQAYATLTKARAEAEAIELVNKQLKGSPLYVDLVKAKRWDGKLPTTSLGSNATPLLTLK